MGAKPPVVVELVWDEELRFAAHAGGAQLVLDGQSKAGPSPMQALAAALAGCMAMDVVSMLTKGRHGVEAFSATVTGVRAGAPPTRFTACAHHPREG